MAIVEETVPKRVKARVDEFGNSVVSYTKDGNGEFQPETYAQMWETVRKIGTALLDIGVSRGRHVGIISDNRAEWMRLDLATLGIGAADVPRGADATEGEIAYILGHAECKTVVAENGAQAQKILNHIDELPELKTLILIDDDRKIHAAAGKHGIDVFTYANLLERGEEKLKSGSTDFDTELAAGKTDEIATLIYTSGTTGEPKGVMLRHGSFIFQMDRIKNILFLDNTDIFISILPIWHSFERAVEYVVMNYAAALAYSKPIGQIMLDDMAKIRPTWMTSVPRIWEGVRAAVYRNAGKQSVVKQTLFHFFVGVGQMHAVLRNMFRGLIPQFQRRSLILDRIISIVPLILLTPFKALGDMLVFKSLKERLGGRFVAGVSGGGALPPHVDNFFQAAGIKLLEGYGLTETGPILAVRRQLAPIVGTVGELLPDIEHKVLDASGRECPPGEKGVLWVKSEQIMAGYYKNPDATAEVLKDGWLNTGDVCLFTHTGAFRILGRVKETIVLLGGENIEPTPIEDRLVKSEYIDQAMVVGQDQKFLGALIVPNEEKMEEFAVANKIDYIEKEELFDHEEFREVVRKEIESLINAKSGFKIYEHVYRFKILPQHFEQGKEMTNTLKLKRDVITEKYKREIAELFR
ncbi:MAG: AMP-dependent synthetase/ligase [bacterium]